MAQDGHVAVPLAGYAASAGAMALRLLAATLAVGLAFRPCEAVSLVRRNAKLLAADMLRRRDAVHSESQDNVTQYCYRTGDADVSKFTKIIDREPAADVRNDVVLRPNTRPWCKGSMQTGPEACKVQVPTFNATPDNDGNTPENVMRGYDLVQTPSNATCETPRVLYIHGGDWDSDSPFGDANYYVHTSKIARHTGGVVLSVDYPLIGAWRCQPGKSDCKTNGTYIGHFAGIQEYAEEAWRWLAHHGPNAARCPNASPPMFIAGDSSGGGSAMSLLLRLNQRRRNGQLRDLAMPAGAFFESPWLNLRSDTPTYWSNSYVADKDPSGAIRDHGDIMFHYYHYYHFPVPGGRNGGGNAGKVKNWGGHAPQGSSGKWVSDPKTLIQEFYVQGLVYCGLRGSPAQPPETVEGGTCGPDEAAESQARYWLSSPYWAEPEQLRGLPPLYFATSSTEAIAGDTTRFAETAAAAGVQVTAELFRGMWHTFPQWSEGCRGSQGPLWQGVAALTHFGDFVHQVAAARGCQGVAGKASAPLMSINILEHGAAAPAGSIAALKLELCAGAGGQAAVV
mmetsp:Transcript_68400/g.147598  ORF Transcript_68400/g.147598 Transcript_68400/m.147598 type:complete len:565 (-) Transcript_68400:136-1830(-)